MNTNVIIIGGGPAGLTAGIYAARAGLFPIIFNGEITQNEMPGGQLMITTEVENFPGFPDGITGPELIENMTNQAKRFGTIMIEKFVTSIEFGKNKGDLHKVSVNNEEYTTECIILANGARARWLNAGNEHEFVNKGISACATCDGPLPCFRNKVLAVVGGGDSACEEALFLTRFASKVYIIHRRNVLRASDIMQQRVFNNDKIEIMWNKAIDHYTGNEQLENIIFTDGTNLTCSGLFMGIGHIPNTEMLHSSDIQLSSSGYIITDTNQHVYTKHGNIIPGVYTAGDCHDQVYRQAITAAGYGCSAALQAEHYLNEFKLF